MFALLFRSPLAFFVLCSLILPVAILLFIPFTPGSIGVQSLNFLTSGRARLFHMFVAVGPVLWLASLLAVSHDFKRGRSPWPGSWQERTVVVLCTVLLATLCTLPVTAEYITRVSPLPVDTDVLLQLPGFRTKSFLMGLLYAGVVSLHTFGMLGVHVQLIGRLREYRSHQERPEAEELHEEVQRYQRLRSQLERFFSFTAAIIGTQSLSVGAFRNLLNELHPSQPEVFPASLVMIYGLYFTMLLALIYLPAHKSLKDVGQVLTDHLVRRSLGACTSWHEWSQEQQAVRAYLGLQSTSLQEFLKGITVLAPFVASISSLLIGARG